MGSTLSAYKRTNIEHFIKSRVIAWAGGGEPDDLPRVDATKAKKVTRDVFAYVIHEGKVRAPSGAMELIERVK
jgi:hypothetical protein